ncbi:Pkinase-domain-containing protein [Violaceomyces palustris]|uniref:Pkinase-domain-containing protein n=1 Tax=Violaceomyces palustris TaxID=1673888 RepID=A0ACD0P7T2_9BASI|nr:Pkinase-domain-containing protein [Violaceomyces palustris]
MADVLSGPSQALALESPRILTSLAPESLDQPGPYRPQSSTDAYVTVRETANSSATILSRQDMAEALFTNKLAGPVAATTTGSDFALVSGATANIGAPSSVSQLEPLYIPTSIPQVAGATLLGFPSSLPTSPSPTIASVNATGSSPIHLSTQAQTAHPTITFTGAQSSAGIPAPAGIPPQTTSPNDTDRISPVSVSATGNPAVQLASIAGPSSPSQNSPAQASEGSASLASSLPSQGRSPSSVNGTPTGFFASLRPNSPKVIAHAREDVAAERRREKAERDATREREKSTNLSGSTLGVGVRDGETRLRRPSSVFEHVGSVWERFGRKVHSRSESKSSSDRDGAGSLSKRASSMFGANNSTAIDLGGERATDERQPSPSGSVKSPQHSMLSSPGSPDKERERPGLTGRQRSYAETSVSDSISGPSSQRQPRRTSVSSIGLRSSSASGSFWGSLPGSRQASFGENTHTSPSGTEPMEFLSSQADLPSRGIQRQYSAGSNSTNDPAGPSVESQQRGFSSLDRVLIQVTEDNERFAVVDISGIDSAEAIKERMFSKLHMYDEDYSCFQLFRTEIGQVDARGPVVNDDALLALCLQMGDDKGTLKFLVQQTSPPKQPNSRALPPPTSSSSPRHAMRELYNKSTSPPPPGHHVRTESQSSKSSLSDALVYPETFSYDSGSDVAARSSGGGLHRSKAHARRGLPSAPHSDGPLSPTPNASSTGNPAYERRMASHSTDVNAERMHRVEGRERRKAATEMGGEPETAHSDITSGNALHRPLTTHPGPLLRSTQGSQLGYQSQEEEFYSRPGALRNPLHTATGNEQLNSYDDKRGFESGSAGQSSLSSNDAFSPHNRLRSEEPFSNDGLHPGSLMIHSAKSMDDLRRRQPPPTPAVPTPNSAQLPLFADRIYGNSLDNKEGRYPDLSAPRPPPSSEFGVQPRKLSQEGYQMRPPPQVLAQDPRAVPQRARTPQPYASSGNHMQSPRFFSATLAYQQGGNGAGIRPHPGPVRDGMPVDPRLIRPSVHTDAHFFQQRNPTSLQAPSRPATARPSSSAMVAGHSHPGPYSVSSGSYDPVHSFHHGGSANEFGMRVAAPPGPVHQANAFHRHDPRMAATMQPSHNNRPHTYHDPGPYGPIQHFSGHTIPPAIRSREDPFTSAHFPASSSRQVSQFQLSAGRLEPGMTVQETLQPRPLSASQQQQQQQHQHHLYHRHHQPIQQQQHQHPPPPSYGPRDPRDPRLARHVKSSYDQYPDFKHEDRRRVESPPASGHIVSPRMFQGPSFQNPYEVQPSQKQSNPQQQQQQQQQQHSSQDPTPIQQSQGRPPDHRAQTAERSSGSSFNSSSSHRRNGSGEEHLGRSAEDLYSAPTSARSSRSGPLSPEGGRSAGGLVNGTTSKDSLSGSYTDLPYAGVGHQDDELADGDLMKIRPLPRLPQVHVSSVNGDDAEVDAATKQTPKSPPPRLATLDMENGPREEESTLKAAQWASLWEVLDSKGGRSEAADTLNSSSSGGGDTLRADRSDSLATNKSASSENTIMPKSGDGRASPLEGGTDFESRDASFAPEENGTVMSFASFDDDGSEAGTWAQPLDSATSSGLQLPLRIESEDDAGKTLQPDSFALHDPGVSPKTVSANAVPIAAVSSPRRPELRLTIDSPANSLPAHPHSPRRKSSPNSAVTRPGDSLTSATSGAHPLPSPSYLIGRSNSFAKRDTDWAFRPPPEQLYENLDDFFPKHDLDKPLLDAAATPGSPSIGSPKSETSPVQVMAQAAAGMPFAQKSRIKRSIRIVAQDRKRFLERLESRRQQDQNVSPLARRRSTRLWGGKVVEMTPGRDSSSSTSAMSQESPCSESATKPVFKWVKGDLIGKGTYGRVYLALNATTGEMIAVKQVELPRTASDREDSRQRGVVAALKSEIETLKDLDHPHVVSYLGFEETDAFLSIFLEYVPGGSVGSCLRKHGKFEEATIKSFLHQILKGLAYLHSKGILHRDLKADNILVDFEGTCKISDFGTVRRSDDIYGNVENMSLQGSIFWMAPEVVSLSKKGYSAKVDIWSLGCVVLEMFAGRRPWSDDEAVQAMFKVSSRPTFPCPAAMIWLLGLSQVRHPLSCTSRFSPLPPPSSPFPPYSTAFKDRCREESSSDPS